MHGPLLGIQHRSRLSFTGQRACCWLQVGDQEGLTFTDYKPAKLSYGKQHPDAVVETASLAAVEPPDVTYEPRLEDQIEDGTLSGLQLESIVYACQRHEHYLPDGSRAGFFIGDGGEPILPCSMLLSLLSICLSSAQRWQCSRQYSRYKVPRWGPQLTLISGC